MHMKYFLVLCVLFLKCIDTEGSVICGYVVDNRRSVVENANYCPETFEHGTKWPKTPAGSEALSENFCFKSDGFPLIRDCVNGTNGPFWALIIEECIIPKWSFLTNSLLSFVEAASKSDNSVGDELLEVSKNYQNFTSFDVYLSASVACFLRGFEFQTFLDILNNILNINSTVLMESQTQMNALDFWIDTTRKRFKEFDMFAIDYVRENIVVERNNSGWISGIFVEYSENERRTIPIQTNKNHTLQDILKEDFEFAIWAEPISEIDDNSDDIQSGDYPDDIQFDDNPDDIQSSLTFAIYFNKIFYIRPSSNENIGIPFTFITTTTDYPRPVYVIQRLNESSRTQNAKCADWDTKNYWFAEFDKGQWKINGEFQYSKRNNNSYFICKYTVLEGNFVMIFPPEKRINEELSDILSQDTTSQETLSRLLQVTSRQKDIDSSNIFSIGQVFKKVSNRKDAEDLKLLSDIISNLHEIDQEVLSKSQKANSSTDFILYYTDMILQNYEYKSDSQIVTKNFITLVYTLRYTDFSGFVVFDNNTITVLVGSVDATDLSKFENLESAVILSSELKNQLRQDTKIVVNVFHNDTLFNEEKKSFRYEPVKRIYSVLIPDLSENFSGPISIFHNASANFGRRCSHWFYNFPKDKPGFWKNDTTGNITFSLIQCDYWHATHFGLLLFHEDKYKNFTGLDLITNVNSSLSLFGYLSILVTAFLFSTWRAKSGKKVLLSFTISGLLQIIVFYISCNIKDNSYKICVVTGVVLHYSVLVQFAWMLLIGIFQYRQLVLNQKEQITHILLKMNFFAWGFPLIPVLLTLTLNMDNYTAKVRLCYPKDYALFFGVWWPISVVIVINLIMGLFIINTILDRKTQSRSHGFESSFHHLARLVFIFFFFGLTWIFGFLAEVVYSGVFVYLFVVFSTLQGFMLFLFYIVSDKEVREMYRRKFYPSKGKYYPSKAKERGKMQEEQKFLSK